MWVSAKQAIKYQFVFVNRNEKDIKSCHLKGVNSNWKSSEGKRNVFENKN